MLISEFHTGQRVKLNATLDVFNIDTFPQGACGTVDSFEREGAALIVNVLMDDVFPGLMEWDNRLAVCDIGEVSANYFDAM